MNRIFILGGGAWGTALAQTLARADREVLLWAHETDTVAAINAGHENPVFLPGVALDPGVRATADLAEAARAELVLLAVPAQFVRAVTGGLTLAPAAPVVICTKGVETRTGALMSEVLSETLPGVAVAVLSGPTFASEVARGQPTAVTLAASDRVLGEKLVAALGSRAFRPYLSDDPVGAEIGGAIKNVEAIACGIVVGRGLGENARAALLTRGLAEMMRLAVAKGGRHETLFGLSGLGDLTLTCTSLQSRNYSLGVALGEGRTLAEIQGARRSVAEGVSTAPAAVALATRVGVEMPIAAGIDAILHRGAAIDEVVATLLARPFRSESGLSDAKS
ncbi:MAG TPA: NAD(P)H-dependent glycerol-3-phosphate dehydrogenase [Stellaceae bacterium]|nr:NAD(P)H-dependent glycerol-3-phosphate dehydrogenase [Stellaceae bacterium]